MGSREIQSSRAGEAYMKRNSLTTAGGYQVVRAKPEPSASSRNPDHAGLAEEGAKLLDAGLEAADAAAGAAHGAQGHFGVQVQAGLIGNAQVLDERRGSAAGQLDAGEAGGAGASVRLGSSSRYKWRATAPPETTMPRSSRAWRKAQAA